MFNIAGEGEVEYEDSDPEKYATSVYSAPHWMVCLENPNKRRKLRASSAPQARLKLLDTSALALPGSRDLSSGNGFLCRPEPEISDFSIVASARLSWNWLCRTAGAREENVTRSIRARAYTLPRTDLDRKIKRKVNSNTAKQAKREVLNASTITGLDKEIQRQFAAEEKSRLSYEEQIVSLFCNHCKLTFKAKPTYRRRFNHTLVNHSCSGLKRRQYVLGVKRRKCVFACNAFQGCIYRI